MYNKLDMMRSYTLRGCAVGNGSDRMKIGILTFPNTTSYGAVLQMYALYRAVEQLGGEPEIINYLNEYMKTQKHTSAMQCGGLKRRLKLWAKNTMHARQTRGFRSFEKALSKFPKKPISQPHQLADLKDRYDGVICGSDQVWNPDITGADMSYFLDFCGKSTKRIAYAPSYGISDFTEAFRHAVKPHLLQFDALSAREKPGRDFTEALSGKSVPLVLDPTFLLQQKDWESLEEKHPAAGQEYILYYTVRSSKTLLNFCLTEAAKQNLPVVYIGGNAIKQLKNRNKQIRYAYDITPGQFLHLVHNAKCVVTNSFHGTAFSIHYKKDFFLELSSLTNSRLEQIIEITGTQDRVIGPNCASMDTAVDYDLVYRLLEPERISSTAYLKEAITP